jgi:hypothetical protein
MTARNFSNTTTVGSLTSGIGPADTSLSVTDFTGAPDAEYTITLDRNTETEEICLVTSHISSTLTVTRGYNGTAAQSHSAGATVEHTAIALDFTEANDHVVATSGVHGTSGDLVGTEGAQSILDKTLVSPVLEADVTDGDAVVLVIPAGAEVRNLLRGVDSNDNDVVVIDSTGEITTTRLHSTGTMEVDGNVQIDGTATIASVAVTGNLTVSGDITVTDDLTIDALTARTATFSEAVTGVTPTASTHLSTKGYADALGVATATPSTIVRRDASGNTALVGLTATSGAFSGDVTMDDLTADVVTATTVTASGTVTGATGAFTNATASAQPTSDNHLTRKDYVDDRTEFRCVAQNVTLNASGSATITHSLGATPTVVFVQPRENGAVDTHNIAVTAITSTTFSIRAYYDGAAQGGSVTIPIYWIEMVNP